MRLVTARLHAPRHAPCQLRQRPGGSQARGQRTSLVARAYTSSSRRGEQQQQQQQRESSELVVPSAAYVGRRYRALQGDDFQHPLDQTNTRLLKTLPGLELVAKSLLGPVSEQLLLLENVGTSVRVSEQQLPSVHRLLAEAAALLDTPTVPDVYVRQNPSPNAYTLAISGRKPFIVLHTSLLELLTPKELQAVIAHELGHLKCDHGIWITAAYLIANGFAQFVPFLTGAVQQALLRWLRSAELTCDRAALLVAQDKRVVVSALMKLTGGSPSLAHELNVDAFLEQARAYDTASEGPLGWYLRNAQTQGLSHPLPVLRAREIDKWADGEHYRRLAATLS